MLEEAVSDEVVRVVRCDASLAEDPARIHAGVDLMHCDPARVDMMFH